jgi:4a-hydroxytetrahydrobiopterin dehydratase
LQEIPKWALSEDGNALIRSFKMVNFLQALVFFNRVGEVAEAEGHHPDLHLTDYNKVRVVITTHAISGLSRNDFILAAKIDRIGMA